MHRIEVSLKASLTDARGLGLTRDIEDLGIGTVTRVNVVDAYWLDANLTSTELALVCHSLLADPVIQDYAIDPTNTVTETGKQPHIIEVTYNAGVSDPVEDTIKKALRDLGISNVNGVKIAKRYLIYGQVSVDELETICSRLLLNPIVQHVVQPGQPIFPQNPQYSFKLKLVDIFDPKNIMEVRKQFDFTDDEFQAIVAYFQKEGRSPTDAELETLFQTWSEHCVHKTFKGRITYGGTTINNLLKNTIIKATAELNKPWCLSVFEDNAGVIDFDGHWALCFKVETHNHPSAVEPYGGAATGIGGVIRDPLGTGLGAKPILNTDVFCFAPPDWPYERLPKGVLHPRRVFKGVRAGVADYANRLGIPTLNGAVLFDERFIANPLVFCGTLGLLPREVARRGQQQPGDLIVVAGGRTGRDGIHGVTFASTQLTEKSSTASYSAVQIGNPIVEKKLIDVLMQARDRRLYRRITDCGGGGLSSAVGEMAAETGARVYLEKVPLKYSGLSYSEIWISESQERMVLAVPPEQVTELMNLFASEDVEAAVIGEFTNDQRLRLFYQGNQVCDLRLEFLHEGRPQMELEATWTSLHHPEPDFRPPDAGESLLRILGSWNVCSKEWVIRQYDHEVQGASVLKPLVGKNSDGPGDAAIIRPVLDSEMGVIVANGIKPGYADIDPYWMAASAIDEALRQIIAVGGNLRKVALLDNFCWGNTSRPEMLGALVRASQACHDMALAYETPFISGKDSLNNEFEYEGKIISIPHTLLISAMGIMDDASRAVSMDFKHADDLVYIIGTTGNELGGSEYFRSQGCIGNNVPRVSPQSAKALMDRLSLATERGLVRACHDCSEGGIGVALAEMAFAGELGTDVHLGNVPLSEPINRDDFILFSESNSRFLAEVDPANQTEFEKIMAGTPLTVIGSITESGALTIYGTDAKVIIDIPLGQLKEAWQRPIRW